MSKFRTYENRDTKVHITEVGCIDVKIQNVRKHVRALMNLLKSCIDVKIQNVRKLTAQPKDAKTGCIDVKIQNVRKQ